MRQNSIEKMLEISTKIEKMGVSPQKGSTNMHRVSTKQDLDQLIENYDRNFGTVKRNRKTRWKRTGKCQR